jgi:hypothetical protein
MTPGELAAFDQLLELAMTTTLAHVAAYDDLDVPVAMLAFFRDLEALGNSEFVVKSLAMNLAGVAIRLRRLLLEQERAAL